MKSIIKQALTALSAILLSLPSSAQDSIYKMSLQDVLQLAKQKNKQISISQTEEDAVNAELRDAQISKLPQVNINGSYQRFSKVTLYDGGLSDGHSISRPPTPNSAALGMDAAVTLFAGGRQNAAIREQEIRKDLASLNTLDLSGNIFLQAISAYLNIIRLQEQDTVIIEQIRRAETRYKNIEALFRNQRVTRSDLLRAKLILDNQKLSREQNENDLAIATSRLNVLLDLPRHTQIIPTDSVSGDKPATASLTSLVDNVKETSYAVLRSQQQQKLQENRLKAIRGAYLPTLQAFSAYGVNYPNNLVFPPVDQAYSVGFIGLRAQYNLSSLYHNRNKEKAAKLRLNALQTQESAIRDNVADEANSLYIKYSESLDRISVAESSIEQASANYKIVSAKYFNQLALLTDLLDADNLYLESKYNLIKSQTDALAFYYRLLYTSGKL
ncbi:TolC family protein [Chitinophaga filiformis]|uniref:Outer membrane protein TolC n=1 Tax=Chitinophaga filiformis TaxID=104663 RepID=A0A1G8CSY3_CHIFI|nr:TolC family protein [Chitinophaga filiformis]SDH48667.1 Outer membrane protein TolC [Chitinophaga filiformis]